MDMKRKRFIETHKDSWRFMVSICLLISICFVFIGCAGTSDRAREFQSANYKAYIDAVTKPQPVFEIKAKAGQVLKIENAESITVYAPAGNTGNGNRAIQPFQEPDTPAGSVARAIGSIGSRAIDQAAVFLPWYWVSKAAENVLMKSFDAAGRNTSYSYSDSYNGDYRDIGGAFDNSNRSINGSYNPIDRHDVLNPPVTVIPPVVVIPPTVITPVIQDN